MQEIDLAYRTIYAELLQRSLDVAFEADFDAAKGNFVVVPVKGNKYWYFDQATAQGTKRKYVGPDADEEVRRRVLAQRAAKQDLRTRRKLVSTLVREAGLPPVEPFTGDVVAALAAAGLFRLRCVTVGTVAYQAYSGLLGIRLPIAAMQTGDADFAQFHAVSQAIGDSIPDVLGVLRNVDPTFREIPHRADSRRATRFANARHYAVEFLTPNTGSSENDDMPANMPALGGAAAQPLRFLDYLIHEPVRAVLLHGGGVPVMVPAPERFAVHKLIVAARRADTGFVTGKRDKDIAQAASLFEAFALRRQHADATAAFVEAWQRGTGWQSALRKGVSYLSREAQRTLGLILRVGTASIGEDLTPFAELLASA